MSDLGLAARGQGNPQAALMKIISAVQKDSSFQSALDSTPDLEVFGVASLEQLDGCLDEQPDCALVDIGLPFATDLMVQLKTRIDGPSRDRLPILTVGESNGKQPLCVPDAHVQGASLAQIVETAKAIQFRRARQRRLFDQELSLRVPTVPESVEKAGEILDLFVHSAGYTEEDAVKLGTTIREALGNAAEHGNKNDPTRTIHVNFLRTSDRVTIVITDEGPGFDTDQFLSRASEVSALEHTRSRRENEARPGGLGVYIMKQTCDSIVFNESGNSIYLMKYLPGREPS